MGTPPRTWATSAHICRCAPGTPSEEASRLIQARRVLGDRCSSRPSARKSASDQGFMGKVRSRSVSTVPSSSPRADLQRPTRSDRTGACARGSLERPPQGPVVVAVKGLVGKVSAVSLVRKPLQRRTRNPRDINWLKRSRRIDCAGIRAFALSLLVLLGGCMSASVEPIPRPTEPGRGWKVYTMLSARLSLALPDGWDLLELISMGGPPALNPRVDPALATQLGPVLTDLKQ